MITLNGYYSNGNDYDKCQCAINDITLNDNYNKWQLQ